MDDNFTLSDKALHNSLFATQHDNKSGDILNKFRDLIIVRKRFLKPQVGLINSKYTITDKFANANFGGIFGIFSQLTGCSSLVLLNLMILLVKVAFCPSLM